MKKNIPFSLSIQKEIEKHRLNVESEVDKSMKELKIGTILRRSGIRKEKGWSTVSLLFALIVLPLIKQSFSCLWSEDFFNNFISARKDTYYRFLNHPRFNWRRLVALLSCREIARTDRTPFNEKVIVADDTVLPKTGKNMELVSYHRDHSKNRSQLGYQMLQVGYHNGLRFYPLDMGFHTSKKRPNEKLREMDKRTNGWKRRKETFEKKTDLLLRMLLGCWRNGIDARFVLFDSWFSCDKVISRVLSIGYGVICRLKQNSTRYCFEGKSMTLSRLWHDTARHGLRKINSWGVEAAILNASLPLSGNINLVFVRWTKKKHHVFLCTEAGMEIAEILDYYSRRWVIECYFKDCKQLLGLGKDQSETFDAVVAWASIVMIRYLILVYILAKKQIQGPIGPLFRELAYEHLQLALLQSLWSRIRRIVMVSSHLFFSDHDPDDFLYFLDIVENSLVAPCLEDLRCCAKL